MTMPAPFASWVQGGFECSTMVFGDGRRVDVSASTQHDRRAAGDYALLADIGIGTVRDGLRWHLIEPEPGRFDWSSWRPMLRAAREAGVQVVWDLLHFGFPDWCDPWGPEFVERFAAFCAAAARVHAEETDAAPFWAPVNEISFWSFAVEHGHFAPFGPGRGNDWKLQLVRCAIAGVDAVRSVDPRARCIHTDPVVHVVPRPGGDAGIAEGERRHMFGAWDAIAGWGEPQLGGSIDRLDVIGVNFYCDNEWVRDDDRPDAPGRHRIGLAVDGYRPLHEILMEVWNRYARPILIAETGAEGANGAGWLRYVAGEAEISRHLGAAIEGVCLYPVMDYPGWGDDRHCRCGLIELDAGWSRRTLDPMLAREVRRTTAAAALSFPPLPIRQTAANDSVKVSEQSGQLGRSLEDATAKEAAG